jgi:multidrug/hemolysin transport system permease protein
MTVIAFILSEIYIKINGGDILPLASIAKILGCIVLSVLSSGSLVFFMTSFFKSQNAFGVASTVLGTMIGFLTGIYIPIGSLPAGVQTVIKVFPPSHSGALFRQIMMDAPIKEAFAGAPANVLQEFNSTLGVTFTFGDQTASWVTSVIVLIATAAVFFGLALFNISRKKRSL